MVIEQTTGLCQASEHERKWDAFQPGRTDQDRADEKMTVAERLSIANIPENQ